MMIGLVEKDCHIYYVNCNYAVLDNPRDGDIPTIVKRAVGDPDRKEVDRILYKLGLSLNGESFYREDGLWCNRLIENGNGAIYG